MGLFNVSEFSLNFLDISEISIVFPFSLLRYVVFQDFDNFQCPWVGFTGFYWVLLGFTELYWVWLGLTGFDWVWLGFARFYWVLLGFTGFYWATRGRIGEILNSGQHIEGHIADALGVLVADDGGSAHHHVGVADRLHLARKKKNTKKMAPKRFSSQRKHTKYESSKVPIQRCKTCGNGNASQTKLHLK